VRYARPKTDENDFLIFLYRYEVDEVLHASRQIDFFSPESAVGLARAEHVVNTYPQGSQISVFHDPFDPSVSAIEPGNGAAYAGYRNLGILMLCAGALVLSLLRIDR
jgi:hypothetical protein